MVLEELNGFIHTMRLKDREGGYLTVQDARRWAQEMRELQEEVKRLEIDNVRLQQQLAIAESGGDPMREM